MIAALTVFYLVSSVVLFIYVGIKGLLKVSKKCNRGMRSEILRLRAKGKTYLQITQQLNISKSTVAYHCNKSYNKKQEQGHNGIEKIASGL